MALMLQRWMGWLPRERRSVGSAALVALVAAMLAGCNNNPLPDSAAASNTLFTAVPGNSPRHLDPTASYWTNETPYTYQIYEPLYGYHYLKRPFVLEGKTAVEVVAPRYLDKDGHTLPADAPAADIAESVYDIRLKPGTLYQPHPAFATVKPGLYRYHMLRSGGIGGRRSPWQFDELATRELVAEDYVYAIKRHATTRITTPIYGIFSEYVLGLKDYGELIKAEDAKLRAGLPPASLDKPFLDFRKWPLAGATAPEKYLLRIRIKGKYPQWNYWMAMTFLAPVPWEADKFYAQPGMAANGLSLDTWPVGTGPYMMTEYEQDRRHVMKRNPNYRGELYPCEGTEADKAAGLLADCGKKTPFIDTIESVIEKEGVPLRAKFRQGYYDIPRVERVDDGLEFLVEMDDSASVRRDYTERGFQLPKFADVSSWYLGFNMLDPVVGRGDTAEQQIKNRKLRQAISIAIDWEEYSRIFPKSAGETAMGPLPNSIFGSRHGTTAGINPVTHQQRDGKAVRRPIADAKKLIAEAGYPDGREAASGRPLVLNYDYSSQPTPEVKSQIDWMVKQFAKIDVQLEIRATDNNQFQDKVRRGKHQIFWSGWLADYPDAENFMFLLYGANAKSTSDGENTANYANPEFDALFAQLKGVDDGPQKQALIDRMTALVQQDAPWSFGYFPYSSGAFQAWVHNAKPAVLVRDMVRYYRIDAPERVKRQAAWNQPVWWPMWLGAASLAAVVLLAVRSFQRRERLNARGELRR
jgi:ABC-type transport system substrate-binding protein